MDIKIAVHLFLFFYLNSVFCLGQNSDFSKNSFKFGLGFGYIESQKTSAIKGAGLSYSVAFQRELAFDKVRFYSQLTTGNYSHHISGPDYYSYEVFFNAINFQSGLYLNLINYKSTSLVIGNGIFLNSNRCITVKTSSTGKHSSKFFSEYNFGGTGSVGFRLNPKKSRFAFEIFPISINVGTDKFFEQTVIFSIDYKLK